MKKIFVVNGSPKGIYSGTLKVTNAFLEGVKLVNETVDIEMIHLSDLNINKCSACGECYKSTQTVCKYKDDLTPLMLNHYKTADLVIFSFPLHMYGISSLLQTFLERTLPLLSFLEVSTKEEVVSLDINTSRPDNHKFIYISTCGSTNVKHVYESVAKRMEAMYKNEAQQIVCPDIIYPYTIKKINNTDFFKVIQWAGQDVALTGKISLEIQQLIKKFTQSTENFIQLPAYVTENLFKKGPDISKHETRLAHLSMSKHSKTIELENPKQINKIIQVTLTDISETYQFRLTNQNYEFLGESIHENPDLTLIMSYETYRQLRNGKSNFIDEILKKSITYLGEFKWIPVLYTDLFASKSTRKKELSNYLSRNGNENWLDDKTNHPFISLIPWLISWCVFLFNWKLAGILGFAIALLTLLLKKNQNITFLDKGNVIIFLCQILLQNMMMSTTLSPHVNYLFINIFFLAAFAVITIQTDIPLSAYLGSTVYLKSFSTLSLFKITHRRITFCIVMYNILFILVYILINIFYQFQLLHKTILYLLMPIPAIIVYYLVSRYDVIWKIKKENSQKH